MLSEVSYKSYLSDSIGLLKEQYRSAREEAQKAAGDDQVFLQGQAFGLMQALSLLQQQARAFGIPLDAIQLAGYDPEQQL